MKTSTPHSIPPEIPERYTIVWSVRYRTMPMTRISVFIAVVFLLIWKDTAEEKHSKEGQWEFLWV